jgi:hypothetical protein
MFNLFEHLNTMTANEFLIFVLLLIAVTAVISAVVIEVVKLFFSLIYNIIFRSRNERNKNKIWKCK